MVAAQGALTTNIDTSMDGFTGDQVRGAMMGVVTQMALSNLKGIPKKPPYADADVERLTELEGKT